MTKDCIKEVQDLEKNARILAIYQLNNYFLPRSREPILMRF